MRYFKYFSTPSKGRRTKLFLFPVDCLTENSVKPHTCPTRPLGGNFGVTRPIGEIICFSGYLEA